MPLVLYNTATRAKETFEPIDPKHVRMYVCGPTVYAEPHIGNARPEVVFGLLRRVLAWLYPRVTYVRNITDIEDKIFARARARGESVAELTQRTTKRYHENMAALGVVPPDAEPQASHHIPEMITMVSELIHSGHAYESEGHVLFSVASSEQYGRFSRQHPDDILAGARIEVAPYKRNAADFVLWKPSTADLPGWDSPWGRGRPGWHIECSVMAKAYLGTTFDIHGGGIDLVFPHHENEIAQSVCANRAPLARYWMHNGLINVSGEKMAKSVGNARSLDEILDDVPGETVRLAVLMSHYRQPFDWTSSRLHAARSRLDRWYRVTDGVAADAELPASFVDALEDDLNTAEAISVLDRIGPSALRAGAEFLGLLSQPTDEWFRWQPEAQVLGEAEITALIEQRRQAKQTGDFDEADRLRDVLGKSGIVLEDVQGGSTRWRRKAQSGL